MFRSILIANRGEIACRVIATCQRLGIETVAVCSEADQHARHVRMADRAVLIGPAPAAQSYLDAERIIAAAVESGSEAIHPGYGFLSENADFARAVTEAGLVLIGPPAAAMELMGSKALAKAHISKADVPLIPGYHGDDQSDERLTAEARRVGFPLMLKAAAGGGGKGMRVVAKEADFAEALAAARREASGAFGDQRMILERYLEKPRHIEAQVFADNHGQVVHLYERDCSSQRRHQKIIEEAPAPGLAGPVRERLLQAAVRAARAVDYRGAGTVEFLVDGAEFYFLEMNTRLQVEHPVTEQITGLDLVEWQIRIAAGEPLPLSQDEIDCHGHAMEARVYAEDPERGFLPASGHLRQLVLPSGTGVRVDSGVDAGDEVSVHYDPMIAKIIVHDRDRVRCLARLNQALAGAFIAGLTTNLGFLQRLAADEAFIQGNIDTGLLDRSGQRLTRTDRQPPSSVIAAAACYWLDHADSHSDQRPSPWDRHDGWRLAGTAWRSLELEGTAGGIRIEACRASDGQWRLELNDCSMAASLQALGGHSWLLATDGERQRLQLYADGDRVEICHQHRRWPISRHTRFEAVEDGPGGDGRILAPMPGKVIEIRAKVGQSVDEGQTLAVMEAMKMELAIKAPIAGSVEEIPVEVGDIVEADSLLLVVSAD